jgi:tetratricopeptide (TPR) repeat protein
MNRESRTRPLSLVCPLRRWLVAAAMCVVLATGAQAGPQAVVFFKNSDRFETVEILKRVSKTEIEVRYTSNNLKTILRAQDIRVIQFQFEFTPRDIQKLYGDADYKALAPMLWKNLQPIFPYLDLPYDGAEYLPILVNSLYWTGQHEKINEASIEFLRIDNPSLQNITHLYRMLSAIDQERYLAAEAQMKKIAEDQPELAKSAVLLYARAKIHAGNKEWSKAQETLARLVIQYPKDFDWMPPSLLLSARCYFELKHPKVANQILDEVKLAYPRKLWLEMADDLRKKLGLTTPPAEKVEPAVAQPSPEAGAPAQEPQKNADAPQGTK